MLKAISEIRWSCQSNMLNASCGRTEILFNLPETVVNQHHKSERIDEAKSYLLRLDRSLLRYILAYLEKSYGI